VGAFESVADAGRGKPLGLKIGPKFRGGIKGYLPGLRLSAGDAPEGGHQGNFQRSEISDE